jgi:hypothetical protein
MKQPRNSSQAHHLSHQQVRRALKKNRVAFALMKGASELNFTPSRTAGGRRISRSELIAFASRHKLKLAAAGEKILEFRVYDAQDPKNEKRLVFISAAGNVPAKGDDARWDEENGPAVTGTHKITGDPGGFVITATDGEIESVTESTL